MKVTLTMVDNPEWPWLMKNKFSWTAVNQVAKSDCKIYVFGLKRLYRQDVQWLYS